MAASSKNEEAIELVKQVMTDLENSYMGEISQEPEETSEVSIVEENETAVISHDEEVAEIEKHIRRDVESILMGERRQGSEETNVVNIEDTDMATSSHDEEVSELVSKVVRELESICVGEGRQESQQTSAEEKEMVATSQEILQLVENVKKDLENICEGAIRQGSRETSSSGHDKDVSTIVKQIMSELENICVQEKKVERLDDNEEEERAVTYDDESIKSKQRSFRDQAKHEGQPVAPSPFVLRWSFSRTKSKPVLNLTTTAHKLIFYVSANVGVIYDYVFKDMRLLQGHKHHITSMSVDEKAKWLVTADAGKDDTVIVWDIAKRLPVHTLFSPHGKSGTKLVAISHDAKLLVTVSNDSQQTVAVWLWTYGRETADATTTGGKEIGDIRGIVFRKMKAEHFLVTAENNVLFITWDGNKLKCHKPEVPEHKSRGTLTESIYLAGTRQAITATNGGNLIVWSDVQYLDSFQNESQATNILYAVKRLPLQKGPITVLRNTNDIIVTGNLEGHIRFYDNKLKILYWCNKFQFDALLSIDFHLPVDQWSGLHLGLGGSYDSTPKTQGRKYFVEESLELTDATLEKRPFKVPDFIVSTATGQVGLVRLNRGKCESVIPKADSIIKSLAINCDRNHLCVGNASGQLTLYNFKSKILLLHRQLEDPQPITELQYAPSGLFLVCGCQNGSLLFLNPSLLLPVLIAEHSTTAITQIVFTSDSKYLAHKDNGMYVSLYQCTDLAGKSVTYLGKHHSHYKPIRDLMFESSSPPRLFSLGGDRMLVEYDIANSMPDKLQVLSITRIEQTAIPLVMMMYPKFTEESFILIANSEFKYKLLNEKTKICQKTLLGPTYESPVRWIQLLPTYVEYPKKRHACIISKKCIGIQVLPVDGNPFKSIMMLGHPDKIIKSCITADGKFLFTVGENDYSIFMWQIVLRLADITTRLGGDELTPYYSLLDGGEGGWFMKQMEDYFYYAQILHQGDEEPITRNISEFIPLCELPNYMRAIGYYPTQYEIENMLHEIRCSSNNVSEGGVDSIKFEDTLKLYLNHRPALGVSSKKLKNAFETLAHDVIGEEKVVRVNNLIKVLEEKGECLEINQFHDYMKTLLHQKEGSSTETIQSDDELYTKSENELPLNAEFDIPEELSYQQFVEDILGIPGSMADKVSADKPSEV